jgi:hypothetical protein
MRKLGLSLSLTSAAMAVRSAFKIASVNPVLWWDAESHRAGLVGGAATLFQDSAGATAVSAVEQPVGLVRSIANSGPRKNLLTYSEQFDNAAWSKVNALTVTGNVAVAPDGKTTADAIQAETAGAFRYIASNFIAVPMNTTVTASVYVKKKTEESVFGGLSLDFQGGTRKLAYVGFNAATGVANNLQGGALTAAIQVSDVGEYWRLAITVSDTGGNTGVHFYYYSNLTSNNVSIDGSGFASSQTFLWGAQLQHGSVASDYQKITSGVEYLDALQATSTARPLLTARKNLFTYSSQPESVVWGKNFGAGVTVLAGQALGPDGQQSMARVTSSGAGGALYQSLTPASASVHTYGVYIRQGSAQSSQLAIFNTGAGTYVSVTFGWSNGVPSLIQSTGSTSNIVFEDIGGGLYRLAFTFSTLASGGHWPLYVPDASGGTGSGLVGCFQIVRGVVCGDYQRVNTATDYLVVADAPLMLQFDGVDDALSTGTFAAGTLPADADVYVVMRRDAGDGAALFCYQNGNTTVYCGIADSTSTEGQSSNSGIPTFAVNGAPVPGGASATRAQMAAAIPAGAGPCVLSMHNANLSSWSSFAVAGYGYGVNLKGGVGAVLITPAQPDATRAKIRKALAKAYQITGVV